MSAAERLTRYDAFWSYYLREHARPQTRALHYFGTACASLGLVAFAATTRLWLVPLILLAGYGPAWVGHFFVERNRPATFTYPLWSLVSDYRMAWSWISGRLSQELAKAGVRPPLTED